jgi:hypothetical protein
VKAFMKFYEECGIHLTYHYAGNDNVALKIWRPCFVIAVETVAREGLEVLRPSRMGNEEDGPSWVRSVIGEREAAEQIEPSILELSLF